MSRPSDLKEWDFLKAARHGVRLQIAGYDHPVWSIAHVADTLAEGLARENERLAEEQAVYGVDARDEIALHPLIARAFAEGGLGVFREQRYPADRKRRSRAEGERCDFVLTADGRDLETPERAGTLFDPADAAALDEAFWLEIKIAHQFTIEGQNPRYAAQVLSITRKDVEKLAKDPQILHAGLCLVAFVADEVIAQHDLQMWYERFIERGLPVGYPSTRLFEITNRLGNGLCAVAIAPVAHV